MFADDLDFYLEDHGVPCVVAGGSLVGILNQDADIVQFDIGHAQSAMRDLTVKTSDVVALGIAAKVAITINGVGYEVRQLDQPDDGAFTILKVRKL